MTDTAQRRFQPTSDEIWRAKYRLTTASGEPLEHSRADTYERVAQALAGVEPDRATRDAWRERFREALEAGAIVAGRIVANAGAGDLRGRTSTINCTVSGTIRDSMDDILRKVHEGGLTLKAGCGIGYEFSTLRPRGAWVAGAGARTSGPLSFMDVYDSMCFTIASSGGRRGAQMGVFDISHPDVASFIEAKRTDGRLRQFNLSVLITREFIAALEADAQWPLVFPLTRTEAAERPEGIETVWRPYHAADPDYHQMNDASEVEHRVYARVQARALWDLVMRSTYEFSEPGIILIDRANEDNNNWWCEHLRATNPCVTADTWIATGDGPRQVSALTGTAFTAVLDGARVASDDAGFRATGQRPVVRLATAEGADVTLTAEHPVARPGSGPTRAFTPAGELRPGDRVRLADHSGADPDWPGTGTLAEGIAEGARLVADGPSPTASPGPIEYEPVSGRFVAGVLAGVLLAAGQLWRDGDGQLHAALAPETRRGGPAERAILRACLLAGAPAHRDGEIPRATRALIFPPTSLRRLAEVAEPGLRHAADERNAPRAASGARTVLAGAFTAGAAVAAMTGGAREARRIALRHALVTDAAAGAPESDPEPAATVESITPAGQAPVHDATIPGTNAYDANGLVVHNCGEQPLPEYGACLLGSIDLTRLVRDPLTDRARFDWAGYEALVAVFTRMLDNVVELNALPLERQREEIEAKRRHGMGFLGLGSALALQRIPYDSQEAVAFAGEVARRLAIVGWREGVKLAREKGMAPILAAEHEVTPEMLALRPEMADDGFKPGDVVAGRVLLARYSRYIARLGTVDPELPELIETHGSRFTHHSAIAPTGTIALGLANNASNGIEPSYHHIYSRNLIEPGRKTKRKVPCYSHEAWIARELGMEPGPEPWWATANDIPWRAHLEVAAAVQYWMDASISKTINVATEIGLDEFRGIYDEAIALGMKGCTTFRYVPEHFQGVLVKDEELAATRYELTLDDGRKLVVAGDELVDYDGEETTAANLHDALSEGYYGRL